MPENPEIFQPMTNLNPAEERTAAIRRALAHPRYYDGDIGADIRWLLAGYELLTQHAKSHKRDYDSLAKKLDEADRQVDKLLKFVREVSEWSVLVPQPYREGKAIQRARQLVGTAPLR